MSITKVDKPVLTLLRSPRMVPKGPRQPRPDAADLQLWLDEAPSQAELAERLGISTATLSRWIAALGLETRGRGAQSVLPARRRGGRSTRSGRRPGRVGPEQAARLRALAAKHPELTLQQLRDRLGLRCSREMVRLILVGARWAP